MIAAAIAQAREHGLRTKLLPLVVGPYLSDDRLRQIEAQGVSGLDLCGNGVVTVPGRYTVFRTGNPNRYSTSVPIKNIYRGATSIVARSLLICPTFASVSALKEFARSRGGNLSLSTVSKALQVMEDDLVLSRRERAVQLLQADKLLSFLERNYVPVLPDREIAGRFRGPLPALRTFLARLALEAEDALVATGVSSAPRYTSIAMESEAALYCKDMDRILSVLPFEETGRFPNLRLTQTADPIPYFDLRPDSERYPWASPVQTYLEMVTGEPRMKQSAATVREAILNAPSARDPE
jgi:hypothetical protein